MLDPIETLCELVAIPSVNPMDSGLTGPEMFEGRLTDYLQQLFERLGVPWVRQQAEPERENIIARLDGTRDTIILLEAHQDTVLTAGMTIDPFTPVQKDGRLYGRGSCDVKGPMAAMLSAFAQLAGQKPTPRPTVLMACSVNEEHGFSGIRALADLLDAGGIFPRPPDFAIVAEPTELDVVVAHKGVYRWVCRTAGRACHSSSPALGQNAVYRMARVLAAIERYATEVLPTLREHPLCGPPTISVGTIAGGQGVNTVPDACEIRIDRRILPDENPDEAFAHVRSFLEDDPAIDFPVSHDPPYLQSGGLSDAGNGPLGVAMQAAAAAVVGESRIVGVPYGTNASTLSECGVASVVFGPGSIAQAHTADEWIDVEQLRQAVEIYVRAIMALGADRPSA